MKRLCLVAVVVLACTGWTVQAVAQSAISADGVIESTSGGFKFPDGSVQTKAAVGGLAPVEDTGQTTCWDINANPISCAGTGMDGELQRGVAWPTPRFTDNGDGTVTDYLTGLTWLRDASCLGNQDWAEAFAQVAKLNAGDPFMCAYYTGTYADWRLPNIKELLSLIDYGRVNPALPPDNHFENVDFTSIYWTSTTAVHDQMYAMVVDLGKGDGYHKDNDGYKPFDARVLPIRGGQ